MSELRLVALTALVGLLTATTTGCRRNLELVYVVEDGVVLTDLSRIDVLIEGVDGTFDVVDAEDNYSPLLVHVVSDAVAETILVEIDLAIIDPAVVDGLVLRLRTPGGRPPVRFTPTLVPATGIPLATLAEAMPGELEYAPGEVVTVRLSPAGGPLDGGTGDGGGATDGGTGSDAATTDAAPATDAGIDSGT